MARRLLPTLVATVAIAGCGGAVGASQGGGSGGRDDPLAAPSAGRASFSRAGWRTDFARHSVPLDEITSGGPGKDGIPALDHPRFVDIGAARRFLGPVEQVAVVRLGRAVKAYPIEIMVWHEIVNDRLAGRPIALTYCPLCNSTVAFSRRVDGRTLSFGTTGNLRGSDLVMYDRQTESWWQQITGRAIVGRLTEMQLRLMPSQILSFARFERLYPKGRVLSIHTGYSRPYGQNPYVGYDQPQSPPFGLPSHPNPALPPKERVTAVVTGEHSAVVYPFSRLERKAPVDDRIPRPAVVGARPIVVFFDPRLVSPLDGPEVSLGREVGTAAVFDRRIGSRTLTFIRGAKPGIFRDRETGSTWTMNGAAIAGPLRGRRLRQVTSNDEFWFASAAFYPRADIRR
jgi:uncharacterized protein DUF3179